MFKYRKYIFIFLSNVFLISCSEGAITKEDCYENSGGKSYEVKIDHSIDKYIYSNKISINDDLKNIVNRYVANDLYKNKIILKNELQDDNDLFDYSGYLKKYNKFETYNSSVLSYRHVDGGSGYYYSSDNFIPKDQFSWQNLTENLSKQIFLISGEKVEFDYLNNQLVNLIRHSKVKDNCIPVDGDIITEFNFSNFHVIMVNKINFQDIPNEFGSIYYQLYFTKKTNIKYKESYYE